MSKTIVKKKKETQTNPQVVQIVATNAFIVVTGLEDLATNC
jgi:hypothetical protein